MVVKKLMILTRNRMNNQKSALRWPRPGQHTPEEANFLLPLREPEGRALVVRRTLAEWETEIGRQVRVLRKRAGLTQAGLARSANVSVGTIRNLESGAGSTLSTLVAVARALGRTEWLEALAPPVTVSPLELLAARDRREDRR
jgi:DNA-binding XRE family transcriptional regulator